MEGGEAFAHRQLGRPTERIVSGLGGEGQPEAGDICESTDSRQWERERCEKVRRASPLMSMTLTTNILRTKTGHGAR